MKTSLLLCVLLLSGCAMDQAPKQSPQFGNATVYTTPSGVGGVSYSHYEVTPL